MKTKAAVLWGLNRSGKSRKSSSTARRKPRCSVKLTASGLFHSDHHLVTGDLPMPLPAVGGRRGRRCVVVEVGPGVTEVADGDPVVMSSFPPAAAAPPAHEA